MNTKDKHEGESSAGGVGHLAWGLDQQAALTTVIPEALGEADAAFYCGMSVSFLRQDRSNGHRARRTRGPPYLKIGRAVRYRRKDLDQWLADHLVERDG